MEGEIRCSGSRLSPCSLHLCGDWMNEMALNKKYSKTCLKICFQEVEHSAILRPSLSYHLPLRPLFCLFLSGCLRQVLLYKFLGRLPLLTGSHLAWNSLNKSLKNYPACKEFKFTHPFVVLTSSQMSIITAQSSVVFISLVAFSETNKTTAMFLDFITDVHYNSPICCCIHFTCGFLWNK